MNSLMMLTYRNITGVVRDGDRTTHKIAGEVFTLKEECENDYHRDQLPRIPAGTDLLADFACDSGMYAMCEVDGALHKVKIKLHELHKVDFGRFDARNAAWAAQ